MFDTYGPYLLQATGKEGLEQLLDQMDDDEPSLRSGIGVYIFAAGESKSSMLPWYVGRTWNGFEKRIGQHVKGSRFNSLLEKFGELRIYLLPRATRKGKMVKITPPTKKNGLRSIRNLEFLLIGHCFHLNPDLLNTQVKNFHTHLYVPGYLDEGPGEREKPARDLAKLLRSGK